MRLTAILALSIFFAVDGVQAAIYADYYSGEDEQSTIGFFANLGQIHAPNGDPVSDVHYYSMGAYLRAYLLGDSRVNLVLHQDDQDSTTADPYYNLGFRPVGEQAAAVDPQAFVHKGYFQKFYLPGTAPNGISAEAFNRVHYAGIYPGIDMQFYGSRSGQKISFVCAPGSDPTQIRL